jgi:osmotically-inducible protein OsmY
MISYLRRSRRMTGWRASDEHHRSPPDQSICTAVQETVMIRVAHGIVVLLASAGSVAGAAQQPVRDLSVPPGALDLESNNPVKQASRASDALEKDDESEDMRLAKRVEDALRKDASTGDLVVAVTVDARRVVALHGLVPTSESRSAAQGVASAVQGVDKVDNQLVVVPDSGHAEHAATTPR